MPALSRMRRGSVSACLALLLCTMLLLGGNGGAPAAAIGSGPLYLPLIGTAGQAQIDVTLQLVSNTIVKPGDRIRVNIRVRNDGTAPTTANTLISLPFDNNALRYFTEDIDPSRGDRFLGITNGNQVRLEVGLVNPTSTATVSVWFNIRDGVAGGTEIRLRASYTYASKTSNTNSVSVIVNPPGTVPGYCAPFNGTNGRMTVSPDTGPAGTIFVFESNCFEPGETVVSWLNTPSGVEPLDLRATADQNGRASFRLNSRGFVPGTNYGFVAQGERSGIQVLGPFIVTPSALNVAAPTHREAQPPEPTQAPMQAPAAATGGLRGVVSGDGGVPLADVIVFATDPSGGPEAVGTTDASGAYSFTDLPAASYQVIFMTDQTADATTALYAPTQRTITVASGQTAALDVRLQRGGHIRGIVSGAGNGPLNGVTVFVRGAQNGIIAATTTDAAGVYTTAALPTGSYALEFNPETSDVPATTAYLSTTLSTVAVTAPNLTDNTNVTLALNPNIHKIAGHVRAQGSGAGLAGVVIAVSNSATSQLAGLAITGSDGSYQTSNLPAGAYRITSLTLFSNDPVTRTYVGGVYGSVINLVGPGIRAGVDLTLAQGAQVSGRVIAAGSGTALPGVVVAAHDRASGKVVGLGRSGTDGTYSTSGLPVGTYQIVFAPDLSGDIALAGYQRATVDNVVVNGTSAVTGVNAQLVRDPSKIKYLPMVSRP